MTASPVAESNSSAASIRLSSSGRESEYDEARPSARDAISPQSRKQARCQETVDWPGLAVA